MVLTRPCCVGHVDVKFSLHPMCTSCPDIQITLLKQNITSIGRQAASPTTSGTDVDKVVDFNLTPSSSTSSLTALKGDNNVLDPHFLESHNAEVLCGPVSISSCLDLSGNSGLITLTSPQLLSTKPKAFLIHIKGFLSNESGSSDQPKVSICVKIINLFSNYILVCLNKVRSNFFHQGLHRKNLALFVQSVQME